MIKCLNLCVFLAIWLSIVVTCSTVASQTIADAMPMNAQRQLRELRTSLEKLELAYFNCHYKFQQEVIDGNNNEATPAKLTGSIWLRKQTDVFLRQETVLEGEKKTEFEIKTPRFDMTGIVLGSQGPEAPTGTGKRAVVTNLDPTAKQEGITTNSWYLPAVKTCDNPLTLRQVLFDVNERIDSYSDAVFQMGDAEGSDLRISVTRHIKAAINKTHPVYEPERLVFAFRKVGRYLVLVYYESEYDVLYFRNASVKNQGRARENRKVVTSLEYSVSPKGIPEITDVIVEQKFGAHKLQKTLMFTGYSWETPSEREFSPSVYGIEFRGTKPAIWPRIAFGCIAIFIVSFFAVRFYRPGKSS